MSFASRLKIENMGILLTAIFYAAAGVAFLVLLSLTGLQAIHVGLIGIISLATAYGVFRKRKWSIWPVLILFFVGTTFSAYMLYYYLPRDSLAGTGTAAYLILTWIFTGYAAAKRKTLET